ncbi:MAG: glycoside hydrolase family 43 protein, partial [bacterium]
MTKIINPILSGFNPDPSIIRVEEDYYIATSTFEWFPGVQIYHSKDLVNWELIARPLNRVSQLDMKGNPDSGGIWAPCLSYDNGIFYLVYTDVKGFDNVWWDTNNYLVSTKDIRGDWSEPIYLNSCGFDPSLFHDSDGKKYFVNMITDHRGKNNRFNEIQVQEYSASEKSLLGEAKTIFKGTGLGSAEGAHLYKLNGYYYLITAEGGTGYNHVVSFARSKNIAGPYEVHPDNPILSSKYSPDLPLQKAGHGDIIETQTGEWYMVHLCGRPLEKRGNCPLGRETAIQRLVW